MGRYRNKLPLWVRLFLAPRPNILVIDNDPLFLQIVGEHLWEHYYPNRTVSDPKEALNKLSHETFDLIIMDLSLQSIDSLDLASLLLKDYPIVFISSEDSRKKRLHPGHQNQFLAKSKLFPKLIPTIFRAIDHHEVFIKQISKWTAA